MRKRLGVGEVHSLSQPKLLYRSAYFKNLLMEKAPYMQYSAITYIVLTLLTRFYFLSSCKPAYWVNITTAISRFFEITQHCNSTAMPNMATFDTFISSITSLDMLTEDALQKIWRTDKESILLPNVNVRVLSLTWNSVILTRHPDYPFWNEKLGGDQCWVCRGFSCRSWIWWTAEKCYSESAGV